MNDKLAQCESLVGRRFSFKTLKEVLDEIFESNGKIIKNPEQVSLDYFLVYEIDDNHAIDIYYLKMRKKDNFNGNNIYITEIGNEIY